MSNRPPAPPGATSTPGAAATGASSSTYLVDLQPLDEPSNPYGWQAVLLQEWLPTVRQEHPAQLQHLETTIQWLGYCCDNTRFQTRDPKVILVLAEAAVDAQLRRDLYQAVHELVQLLDVPAGSVTVEEDPNAPKDQPPLRTVPRKAVNDGS